MTQLQDPQFYPKFREGTALRAAPALGVLIGVGWAIFVCIVVGLWGLFVVHGLLIGVMLICMLITVTHTLVRSTKGPCPWCGAEVKTALHSAAQESNIFGKLTVVKKEIVCPVCKGVSTIDGKLLRPASKDGVPYSSIPAEHLNNIGSYYHNRGHYQRATTYYDEATRLMPTFALAFCNRGLAYMNVGNHDCAIEDFNEAIRLDPKLALAFAGRGGYYVEKGDDDRAIADLNEAIRLDRKSSVAFKNLGILHERRGDFDEAIKNYEKAVSINGLIDARDRGALLYARAKNNYSAANRMLFVSNLDKNSDPIFAPLLYARGLVHSMKGDHARAIVDFQEALKRDPNHADARAALEGAYRTAALPHR